MKQVSLTKLFNDISFFIDAAKKEKIFIYPTNTVYGVGSIITPSTITTINKVKKRLPNKSFSIIAPSFSRIKKYFKNTENIEPQRKERQHQFPERGLTILLEANKQYEEQKQLLSTNNLIGVRLLQQHPFQKFIEHLDEAFITTSANISGQKTITQLSDIAPEMEKYIDYAIDAGILDNQSSVVIDGKTGKVLRK